LKYPPYKNFPKNFPENFTFFFGTAENFPALNKFSAKKFFKQMASLRQLTLRTGVLKGGVTAGLTSIFANDNITPLLTGH